MEKKELINRIRLINSENVGPVSFYRLLRKFGSAAEALSNLPERSQAFTERQAAAEIERADTQGIRLLTPEDKLYPKNLRQLNDAPPILYVRGNAELLNHPLSVSVVGARNASVNGRKLASRLAYDLTDNDILIISGMARGIDSAAHKGAMYAKGQQGPTVAVLGTGVDTPYPLENRELYEQIAAQGAIVSELPLGTKPQANNFPRRNRIVAALSSGTLVVEANLNSGSLITARLALEQGKEIFAVPGSPLDGRSLGTNKLIKEGAVLVESYEDVLTNLNLNTGREIRPLPAARELELFDKPLDKVKNNADIPQKKTVPLTEFLTYDGVYVDELIRSSGLSAAELSVALLELEMDNKIERQPGNKVALIKR